MEQKSIALTRHLWQELREESGQLGIGLGEYLRQVLRRAKPLRKKIVEGDGE